MANVRAISTFSPEADIRGYARNVRITKNQGKIQEFCKTSAR